MSVEEDTVHEKVAALLCAARSDIGMTLEDVAAAADIDPALLSAWEVGDGTPETSELARILRTVRLRPGVPLALHADEILDAADRHHLVNVRVFGSAVRGHDTEDSDIDLFVGATSSTSLFDLGGFALAVEGLTGIEVDLLIDDLGDDPHFAHVLAEAVPL
ncbi:nucleotidyltransferase domain-containing protein [Curtobacterium sp. 458]|uniref:nucleotidyltransferase domain-containing protein n=1 Tax=Curtobacterium sp. 458 TaxID=3050069 RepID=UPI0025B58D5E|nr:nucleotidyltransferase domain-containing protein [Curtobacterium sp. 458]WJY00221.1 nucleotidyltransferase domain-containing protein [Curtobacterium sp. 458]